MTLEVSFFADSIDLVSRMPAKKLTKKIHLHFVTCPGVHHVLFIWERCTAGLEKRSSRKSPPKGGIFYTPTIIVFCAHANMVNAFPQILSCTVMRRGHQENHLPRGDIFGKFGLWPCCQMNNLVLSPHFFSTASRIVQRPKPFLTTRGQKAKTKFFLNILWSYAAKWIILFTSFSIHFNG